MAENHFGIEAGPNLAQQLYRHVGRDEAVLLRETGLGEPIDSVDVASVASGGAHQFGRLEIVSNIGLSVTMDAAEVIEGLATEVNQGHEGNGIRLDPHQYPPDMDSVLFTNWFVDDANSLIVPTRGAKSWLIKSVLGHFKFDQGETDVVGVNALVTEHLFILNALATVIINSHNAHQLQPSRIFQLRVPEPISEDLKNADTPKDEFEGFIGIDNVVESLREMVRFANMPSDLLAEHDITRVQAVLFHGPQGVGKTELMNRLARQLKAEVVDVDFGDVGASYTGEWARKLDAIFEAAYLKEGRVLIQMDEFDGLITTGNVGSNDNIKTVMKRQLEKLKQHPNVFFAAATNKIEGLDPAVVASKRIPLKIPIGLPSDTQRADLFRARILGKRLSGIKLDDVSSFVAISEISGDLDFDALAAETEGFSPGDIIEVIAEVTRKKLLASSDLHAPVGVPSQISLIEAIKKARLTRLN